jgi:hypothetical protein
MWFVNFVLGAAVAVTVLVFGSAAYFDHVASVTPQVIEVIPIPRAAPRPPKPQTVADEDEDVVREPKPKSGKSAHVRHRPRAGGRGATW